MSEPRHDPYGASHVRKGLLNFLASKGVQVLAGIASMLLLVRLLPVADYALYVTCAAMAMMVGTLSLFGMDRAASRYVPEALLHGSRETLLRFLHQLSTLRLAAVVSVAAIVAAAWQWMAPLFNLPLFQQQPLLVAATIAWAVLHAMLFFQTAVMQSLMCQVEIRTATALVAVAKVGTLAFAFVTWRTMSGAWAVMLSVAVDLLGFSWLAVAQRRHIKTLPAAPDGNSWIPSWGEIRSFSGHNYLGGQFALPTQLKPVQLVAAAILPAPEMAGFGFVTNLASNLRTLLPLYLFRSLLEPVLIGQFVRGGRDATGFAASAAMLGKLCALVVFGLVAWLVVSGADFVAVLTGGRYTDEAWMMAVMVAGMLPACWRTLVGLASNAEGSNAAMVRYTAVAGVLSALLLAAAVAGAGTMPLLLSEALFSVVVVALYLRSRSSGAPMIRIDLRPLLRLAPAAMLAAGAGWASGQIVPPWPSAMRCTLFAITVFGLYFAGVWALKVFAVSEIALARKLLRRNRVG